MRLGVDLGTSRTVVAVADRGNFPVVGFAAPNGDVVEHYPSLTAEVEAAIARYRYPGSAVPVELEDVFDEMSRLDVRLAKKTTKLLKNTSIDLARAIQAEDEKVDELHRSVFETVLSPAWEGNAMFTVDVTLASRYLERFADHVVDISSKVSYLTTGDWSDAESEDK